MSGSLEQPARAAQEGTSQAIEGAGLRCEIKGRQKNERHISENDVVLQGIRPKPSFGGADKKRSRQFITKKCSPGQAFSAFE